MDSDPHDTFFKRAFGRLDVAADHFRRVLPTALVERIDWSTLQREPEETQEHGRALRRDLLFSVRTVDGEPALLYLVFEHQSTVVPLMALRIVDYEVTTLRRWVRAEKARTGSTPRRLPRVIAMVLYHGRRRWTAPTRIEDLVDDGLGDADPMRLRGGFHLLDLGHTPDEALDGLVHRGLALLLLKHVRSPDFWLHFPGWLGLLSEVARLSDGRERVSAVLHYVGGVLGHPPVEVLHAVHEATRDKPVLEDVVQTWADSLRQEGLEKGLEKGLEELRDALRVVLVARFGPLDEAQVERIHQASLQELKAGFERVLTAESVEAVLRSA